MNRFLILFFLGLLVYCNSFSNKFLIDDYAFLINPTTSSTKFLLFQFSPFQQFDQGVEPQKWSNLVYYRPLAHIVPAICYSLFKHHFWQYHLFNLALFVFASFLIYLCVLRISKNDGLSLLVSAFYIIHPINGIVVNYITASVFALQVIFISASILCVWESIERHDNRILYYLSLVLMVLALLCHETSLMVPFYVGAVLVITKCLDQKRLIKCLIPYFLILLVYLLFRTYCVSLNDTVLKEMATYKMNFFEYTATLFTVLMWYIGQLFFPQGIVMVWATPVIREGLVWANLGMAALICFFIASFISIRRHPIARIGLMWLAIGFLPMGAAPFNRPYDGAGIEPHWFVFPVIGFFILMAYGFLSVYSKMAKGKKWIAWVLLFGLGVYWIGASHAYNRLWSNEKTYTRYWSDQVPQLRSVYGYLGHAYTLEGNWDEARKNYLLSLTGNQNDVVSYIDLGVIEREMGHLKQADAYFQESLRIWPTSYAVYTNLGYLYFKFGKLDQSRYYFEKALNRNPYEPFLLKSLISISLRKKDISSLDKYVSLYLEREENPQALMHFGDTMVKDHFFGIALKSYQKAAENAPNYDQIQELLTKERVLFRTLQSPHP